jgi:outer membrane autotransporter protein
MSDGKVENDHPDSIDTQNQDLGLFLTHNDNGDYCMAVLAFGTGQYDIRRRAASAVMNSALVRGDIITEAETDSCHWSAYVEKGLVVVDGDSTIQTYVALNYAGINFDDLAEEGESDFALDVDFDSQDSFRSVAGIRLERAVGSVLGVGLDAAWTHEFCDADSVSSALGGTTGRFAAQGIDLGTDFIALDAVLSARIRDGFSLRASCGVVKGVNQSAYSASIGGSYVW